MLGAGGALACEAQKPWNTGDCGAVECCNDGPWALTWARGLEAGEEVSGLGERGRSWAIDGERVVGGAGQQ